MLAAQCRRRTFIAAAFFFFFAAPTLADYDPSVVASGSEAKFIDLTVEDSERQREIPLRIYLPKASKAAPVVLFSHGLGGSREGSSYLGKHWASRGYAVVYVQHPGSDSSVWQDTASRERLQAMKQAANPRNFFLRVQDIPAVLDQLAIWNKNPGHALAGRLDLERLGMSGHSFGAVTTQAVSGQAYRGEPRFTDPRIKAAVAFSPNSPQRGAGPEQAFGQVEIPWLLMTGTQDVAQIGTATVESRLAVFPALPPGSKYELLLHDATHSAFSERRVPGERRNPNHHRAILTLSTAFWDAYLRDDSAARKWLDGSGPRTVLEEQDRWQKK